MQLGRGGWSNHKHRIAGTPARSSAKSKAALLAYDRQEQERLQRFQAMRPTPTASSVHTLLTQNKRR